MTGNGRQLLIIFIEHLRLTGEVSQNSGIVLDRAQENAPLAAILRKSGAIDSDAQSAGTSRNGVLGRSIAAQYSQLPFKFLERLVSS